MLYIGIPAYNEATTIGVLLWRLRSVLSEVSREYEVVVYDDASTDETASTLAPYTRVLPLTILRGAQRIGYAGAVDALARHVAKTTRYPRRDALLLLQGDFTDPPALVPEFLRRFEGGADLIIGERTSPGDAPTAVRRLWQASRWVLRPFVGITDIRDLTASYRLVRIAVLRDLIKSAGDAPVAVGDGWSANADFLLRAAPFARRVETIPVTPTFAVRTRESRRTAWPDALALAKWGWGRRGQRVAVKVIARTVEVPPPEADETAVADAPERSAPPERRERPDRSERRPRRDATDRPEREKPPRPAEREKTPRVDRGAVAVDRVLGEASAEPQSRAERAPRPAAVASASSAISVVGSEDEASLGNESAETVRKPRKRRKRGSRRERVAGAEEGVAATEAGSAIAADSGEPTSGDNEGDQNEAPEGGEEGAVRPRRKRSRRGRRRKGEARAGGAADSGDAASDGESGEDRGDVGSADQDGGADTGGADEPGASASGASRKRRSRRGRRGGSRRRAEGEAGGEITPPAE